MSGSAPTATDKPRAPRRRWFRFLYQFSLRTMLIGMTLAAVACWWLLRPAVQEEELAGRYLKLRRQVRVVGPASDSTTTDIGQGVADLDARTIVSVGSWQLRDENDDLLVDGRYDNDLPHGRWVLWHANGRKAAEGDAFRGGRTGLWRGWDERGTLRSEVTYRAIAPPRHRWNTTLAPAYVGRGPSGLMMIGPVAQMPPPYVMPKVMPVLDRYMSQRHGPCRVWDAEGRLQYEGQYADDRRDGVWTTYDERGEIVERGTYKADLRDGEWIVALAGTKLGPGDSGASGGSGAPGASLLPAKVTYIAGRTQAEHEALLARLRDDLAADSLRRQVAAATRLESLGPAAVPVLIAALDNGHLTAKVLALRSLMKLEALHADILPQIEPLLEQADKRLALRATCAVYQLAPSRREELYSRIMTLTEHESIGRDLKLDALRLICDLDAERRVLAFMRLVELIALNDADPNFVISPPDMQPIAQFKTDPLPLLIAAFGHSDARVRLYVLAALEQIVESGPGTMPLSGGPAVQLTWPVPPAIQGVLDRARNDPDPNVRMQAEAIGTQIFGGGGPGFF